MDPRRRRYALMTLWLISFLMAGNRASCTRQPPTIDCTAPFNLNVPRGTCSQIDNSCGDRQFTSGDNLEIFDLPFGIAVSTVTRPFVARTICADANAQLMVNQPFNFTYSRPGEYGEGTVYITTGIPLTVAASASPATIALGNSSQLGATASGGVPPYSYAWTPSGRLNQSNIQNPVASPIVNTTYSVTVNDSQGNSTEATIQVRVSFGSLGITANPTTINAGQTSQLTATVSGGSPPYSFSWIPSASLSAANIFNPIATPAVTTIYQVTAIDQLGARLTGSATVTVNAVDPPMSVTLSATPNPLGLPGQPTQLLAVVTGGTAPFTWSWQGPLLSATDIPNPIARPLSETIYQVTVTDSLGQTTTGTIHVTFLIPQ